MDAKLRALSFRIEQLDRRCCRLSRLLGLSVVSLLALVAAVVVFGRLLGIPSSAASFTAEEVQVTAKAEITTIRVKELMILNEDGSVAGSFKVNSGAIAFNHHSKDGTAHDSIRFFEGPSRIMVWMGAWHNVETYP